MAGVTPEQRAAFEEKAQQRNWQKSPRRMSPVRRSSKTASDLSEQSRRSTFILDSPPDQEGKLKIILLGSGESGKSTFAKQMRLIHQGGFTREEIEAYRADVMRNVVESMQQILKGMQTLGIQFDEECRQEAEVEKIFD